MKKTTLKQPTRKQPVPTASKDAPDPKTGRTHPDKCTAPAGHAQGKRSRSDQLEYERRVEQVRIYMLAGLNVQSIFRNVSQNRGGTAGWNVTLRMVQHYAEEARARIRAVAKAVDRTLELGKAMARLEMLYQRALSGSDLRTCLAVQRELSDLLGLRHDEELEERQRRLEELIDELEATRARR